MLTNKEIQHILRLSRLEKAEGRIRRFISYKLEDVYKKYTDNTIARIVEGADKIFFPYLSKFINDKLDYQDAKEEALVSAISLARSGAPFEECIKYGLKCASDWYHKWKENNA